MCLHVALVDDPQAVGVAQVEERGVGRIVAGADGVDVVALHEFDVGDGELAGHDPSGIRVELMAVDAPEDDTAAVDLELAVLDGDGAEADAYGDAFGVGVDLALVQPGFLGAPRRHVRDLGRPPGGQIGDAQLGDGDPDAAVGVETQRAARGEMVVIGVDGEVPYPAGGAGEQGDVTEDAGQPPHVLVFQVAAGGPLVDAYGEQIAARSQQRADIELRGQPAALGHPSSTPLSQMRPQESMPSKRSTAGSSGQSSGRSKSSRWSPVGLSDGTWGGLTGNG